MAGGSRGQATRHCAGILVDANIAVTNP
jgi:hypothetical protein